MFDKLKQIKELRSLQDELKKQTYEIEKNGVRIVMNGGMELVEVRLNPELPAEEQAKALKEAHNELLRKVHMAMATRFRGII